MQALSERVTAAQFANVGNQSLQLHFSAMMFLEGKWYLSPGFKQKSWM